MLINLTKIYYLLEFHTILVELRKKFMLYLAFFKLYIPMGFLNL